MKKDEIQLFLDACATDEDSMTVDKQVLEEIARSDHRWLTTLKRSRQLDAAVRGVMQKGKIPAGLENRLLAAAGAPLESPGMGRRLRKKAYGEDLWKNVRGMSVHGRRVVWLSVSAVLMAMVIGSLGYLRQSADWSPAKLAANASKWCDSLPDAKWGVNRGGAQVLARSPDVRLLFDPAFFQVVDVPVDRASVWYSDYPSKEDANARLGVFVVKRSSGFPTQPPLVPQLNTGRWRVGAWKSQGLVYVLMVRGRQQSYDAIVHPVNQIASSNARF